MTPSSIPERLLQRLDDLAAVLAQRGDAIALIGLGSVGVDLDRIDDHSDLDFFVIVDDDARERYLDSIDWLQLVSHVAFSFANTVDGRKVLFGDGIYAEYAVFTLDGAAACPAPAARVVWERDDAPDWLAAPRLLPEPSPHDSVEWQANEALTNLYVGLHRNARGEKLSAARLIQTHAVDRVLTIAGLLARSADQQDPFAVERGAERRFGTDVPLAAMVPGYDRNPEAALAILDWIEAHTNVDAPLVAAIRRLHQAAGRS
ncbi:MAG TPA: hypothetical protein VFB25_01290 [Gaiellaceae bacterium]|nr:hypothetical protein [Gaiellaceae bacterium]